MDSWLWPPILCQLPVFNGMFTNCTSLKKSQKLQLTHFQRKAPAMGLGCPLRRLTQKLVSANHSFQQTSKVASTEQRPSSRCQALKSTPAPCLSQVVAGKPPLSCTLSWNEVPFYGEKGGRGYHQQANWEGEGPIWFVQ